MKARTAAGSRRVLAQVAVERLRQDVKWGEQNHPDLGGVAFFGAKRTIFAGDAEFWKKENAARAERDQLGWDGILLEEVFEALAEEDPAALREELLQVAAVAVAWVEAIDRRTTAAVA